MGPHPPAPSRWQRWLLTSAAIYPVITVLAIGTAPILRGLPLPLRLAILVPLTVAVMQWVLTPSLYRRVRDRLTRRTPTGTSQSSLIDPVKNPDATVCPGHVCRTGGEPIPR